MNAVKNLIGTSIRSPGLVAESATPYPEMNFTLRSPREGIPDWKIDQTLSIGRKCSKQCELCLKSGNYYDCDNCSLKEE